jgi:hypothetical protein
MPTQQRLGRKQVATSSATCSGNGLATTTAAWLGCHTQVNMLLQPQQQQQQQQQ